MQLPSTKQLRYLVALDEHKHFGQAAVACHVSQSAFSIGIRELETVLGVRLVDRTNKHITITRVGQDVISQARLCLRDLESLVETARGGHSLLTGQLHLGVIPTIAPFLLPVIVRKLRKDYPKLQIYIKEEHTDRVYAGLVNGELDVILIALPYDLRNVETESLFKDHFVLAYCEGTSLVDPLHYTATRLERDSVLLLEDGHCLRDHALKACRIRSLSKVSRFSATSLNTLVQMVDSDLGITFLPEMAIHSALLKGTRVRTQPLKEKSSRNIALVWRKGSGRDQEFRLLAEMIRGYWTSRTK